MCQQSEPETVEVRWAAAREGRRGADEDSKRASAAADRRALELGWNRADIYSRPQTG
ncbi:hypothetical protein DESA109040_11250 [Deinococcus saxicola]